MLNLIQLGADATDADARADVPADDVGRGSGGTTNGVGARGPKDGDALKLIADRGSPGGIEANNVPLHLVRICAASVMAMPCAELPEMMLRPPTCCSTDRVIGRAAEDLDARVGVRNGGGARSVESDIVALHHVGGGAAVVNRKADERVA